MSTPSYKKNDTAKNEPNIQQHYISRNKDVNASTAQINLHYTSNRDDKLLYKLNSQNNNLKISLKHMYFQQILMFISRGENNAIQSANCLKKNGF